MKVELDSLGKPLVRGRRIHGTFVQGKYGKQIVIWYPQVPDEDWGISITIELDDALDLIGAVKLLREYEVSNRGR